jgi:hypothetical protein
MKRLLWVLLILFVLVVAYLAGQRYYAQRYFSEFAKGKTYSSFGIKLTIPPENGKVRGWIKPYLDLPKVIVELGSAASGFPWTLENGRLLAPFYKQGGLILSFPRVLSPRPDLKIDHLNFELVLQDQIRKISAASIEQSPSSRELLRFDGPQIYLGAWRGWMPDRIGLEIEAIKHRKEFESGGAPEEFSMKALVASLVSEQRGDERPWKLYWGMRGAQFKTSSGLTDALPFELKLTGNSKDMALDEIVKNYLPSLRQIPALSDPVQLRAAADLAKQLALRLRPELNSMDFYWEGLKGLDASSNERVTVHPLKGVMQAKFGTGEGLSQGKLHWDGMTALFLGYRIQVEDLDTEQSAQYRGIDYSGLLGTIFDQYSFLLFGEKPDSLATIQRSLWLSFAQYPNSAEMKLKAGKVQWTGSERSGEVSGGSLAFKIAADRWEYSAQGKFSHRDAKDALKTIEDGSADLKLSFILPWEKIIGFVRQPNTESQSIFSILPLFAGQLSGLDGKWRVDLGKNLFALRVDVLAEADVARVMGDYGKVDPNAGIAIKEQLQKNLIRSLLREGHFVLKIAIDRLSKFQALMEKVQSGASLGLAVLAPYTVVDPKADTIAADIELKSGQVLVNGKPNPDVEKLLAPFK